MEKGSLLIENASVVTRDTVVQGCSVYCEDGVIQEVWCGPGGSGGLGGPGGSGDPGGSGSSGPAGPGGPGNPGGSGGPAGISADRRVDAAGMYLCPGFIDLHMHGVKGLLAESGKEAVEEICRILPRYGVTGFLPAVCPTLSGEGDVALMEELSQARSEGTEILGFFLEGHYLALTGAISHLPKIMDAGHLERLINALKPYKAVFAVSPEIEGILDLLPYMTASGFPVFITHTEASAEETERAIRAGARHATHFYNVFPYTGDKEPGVRRCGAVEAVLADPGVSVDFILDGEHVDPAAVKMALGCKGGDKVNLITDANLNAGMPPGRYQGLGGSEIEVFYEGGPARLTGRRDPAYGTASEQDSAYGTAGDQDPADGTAGEQDPACGTAGDQDPADGTAVNQDLVGGLAGSGLTMDLALRNATKLLGVSLPQAVAMVSSNPASVLGLKSKGRVEAGFDADLVLLDEGLNVRYCWVGGVLRHGPSACGT